MTAIMQRLVAIRTFSLSLWFYKLVARTTARVVGWAFSMSAVQAAFVEQIRCSSPIGNALIEQIEDSVNHLEAENIHGLDRAIEQTVENSLDEFQRNFEVEADQIKNLNQEVGAILDDYIDDLVDKVDDNLIRLIAQRLSY